MGIQGLLPLLKSIQKPTHLRNFAGQTLGVDAYGWLHRGTVSCAIELAQQKPTRKHIEFALSRVRMLIHFGVKPYLVFDGAYLPSKEHTEKERATRRKESKKLGLELLSMGRVSQAYLELQKAIDVTPLMARELIEELKRLDVSYVVAPYEADSQLAYLEKEGLISGVVSEDSDLLVFGVKCLLTKLDQYGECVLVNRADFTACREISLVGWTDKEFRMMAILSGCDYLPGIDKMGLKTAYRLVRKYKAIERLIRAVQFDGKIKVPAGYLAAFEKAERTFLYQRVFCPEAKRLVHLNKLPTELEQEDMPYIGLAVESDIATSIAVGDLDPNTKERLIVSGVSRSHAGTRTKSFVTPNEKQGKPISEFFRPKRAPLAELDPNSFTPSPSQQALLQSQQGVSWSASQAQPMQQPAVTRANATGRMYSAPQPPRRTTSDSLVDSNGRSLKRQRLCSESSLTAAMDGTVYQQSTTSRFFSKQDPEPSPSLRKPSTPRRKKEEFDLWSDDPAAEVVAEMMAADEAHADLVPAQPRKMKKIKVHVDSQNMPPNPPAAQESISTEHSQTTTSSKSSQGSHRVGDEETQLTSFEADDTPDSRSVFDTGVDIDFTALKAKYAFHSAPCSKQPARVKSMPLASRSPVEATEHNAFLGRLTKQKRGIDDIEDNYTGKQSFDNEHDTVDVPNSSPPSAPKDSHTEIEDEHFICDKEWLEIEQRHTDPSSSLVVQGSEDHLIPNSPESTESESRRRPIPNFGQFAFTGR